MPVISGVLETCLHVEDLARATTFYEDVLGLQKLEGDHRFCALRVGDRQLLLLFKRGGTPGPVVTPGGAIPPHGGSGPLHLAFAIAAAELDVWQQRLVAKHIAIESLVEWPLGGKSLYFRDPDGHLLELATPGTWPIY